MELNTTIRNENNTAEISTDRPNTDRPRGDRPRSDRPRGDRPRSGNFNRTRNNFNRRPEGAEPRRAVSDPTTWNREEITVAIQQNATEFARENGLLREGLEEFTPTEGQIKATAAVIAKLDAGVRGTLIKAPTGAGKTEVEFQAAIDFIFKTGKPVLIISPTKELCRQSWAYFFNRLKKTPFYVRELHSGIAKRDRLNLVGDTLSGRVNVVIATAMILDKPEYKKIVDHVGLIIVDDVNAIDEETQLVNLERYNQPMVFATATPEKVRGFLMTKDAFSNMIEMKSLPFQSPPTTVHRVKSVKNEDIIDQVHRVWGYIDDHVSNKGRVFIISKTKRGVEDVEETIRDQYPDVPVAILHGDMVDTKKKSQALQRMGLEVSVHTRVDMMKKFRENLPAILVSTNLVGSGIDIPMADLMIVTDADGFSEDEIEQLIGRVGRRELASEAVLVYGTLKEPRPVRKPRGRGGFGGYSGGGNRDRDNRGGRGGFGGGGYGGGDRDNRGGDRDNRGGGGYNTNSRNSSSRHAPSANAPRTERSDRPDRNESRPERAPVERSERPDRRPSTEKPREIKGRTLSYFLK